MNSGEGISYQGLQNQSMTLVQQPTRTGDPDTFNMSMEEGLIQQKDKPFDWFILSFLGCLCCPCFGVCAMYYSIRANHGVDWNLNRNLVNGQVKKAKILTLLSIILGTVAVIVAIIVIVMIVKSVGGLVSSLSNSLGQMNGQMTSQMNDYRDN